MPHPLITTVRFFAVLLATGSAIAAPAATLWSFWDLAAQEDARQIDHSTWQGFLNHWVETLDDGRTVLNYKGVSATDRQPLEKYLAALTALDPRTFNRHEQLAYWINLYNALTVRVVLENPEKGSILKMGGLFEIGPWDQDVAEIAGETLSLNDIEHRILRPIWKDHRIHFAINCASVGCPNLAINAYEVEQLQPMLAEAERAYLSHPRGLRFDQRGRLVLSTIFKWYRDDFAGDDEELLNYFASHRLDLAARLRAYDGKIVYQYDWALNQPQIPESRFSGCR